MRARYFRDLWTGSPGALRILTPSKVGAGWLRSENGSLRTPAPGGAQEIFEHVHSLVAAAELRVHRGELVDVLRTLDRIPAFRNHVDRRQRT